MRPDSTLADLEFLRHGHSLRALVRRLLADEHGVEDVLQETWLRSLGMAAVLVAFNKTLYVFA